VNGKPAGFAGAGAGRSTAGDGISQPQAPRQPNIHFYQEFTLRSHGVRRAGSAALDLAYVACGRMDGFWEFNLNPGHGCGDSAGGGGGGA